MGWWEQMNEEIAVLEWLLAEARWISNQPWTPARVEEEWLRRGAETTSNTRLLLPGPFGVMQVCRTCRCQLLVGRDETSDPYFRKGAGAQVITPHDIWDGNRQAFLRALDGKEQT